MSVDDEDVVVQRFLVSWDVTQGVTQGVTRAAFERA
jgi:hypothetical protein